MVVQIQVSDEIWEKLKDMKKRPSQTFDDIIRELIKKMEAKK